MAEAEAPKLNSGIVKLVLSGDSIVIRGVPKGGPPPEKQLNFSGITAPRLARRPGRDASADSAQDEPWAWQAREYLRKRLVGKTVYFTVDYTIPGNNREFGTVFLGRGAGAENITQTLVREGLVKIREGRRDEDSAELKLLTQMDAMNQEQKKGVYSEGPGAIRPVKWTCDDPRALVEANKGKKLQAIIEYVQDGCTARAFLLPSFQSVMLTLTGIKTPGTRKNKETGEWESEKYASESKYFTESRILQQDVFISIEGTDGRAENGKLLASILHPKGNISEFLLKEGFARIVDWSFTQVTEGRDKLRAAEKLAKEKRLRIWNSYVPSVGVPEDQRTFAGTVVEIINSERLVVKKAGTNELKEVSLASVRQPRRSASASAKAAASAAKAASGGDDEDNGYPQRQRRSRPLYDVPMMFESREFLRKTLLGKMCNFNVDFIKPAEEGVDGARGYPEKTCVTLTFAGKNIGEELIRKGLATAMRHRQDDDSRSGRYDLLLDAERTALEAKAGIHSFPEGEGEPMYISEVSSKTAGEQLKGRLEGKRNPTAVVEFVNSGSKMRVFFAKETCLASVLLAGVSCPRTGFKDSPDEPYSQEAKAFVKDMCIQKDVQIEAYDTDKGGNLIASVTVNGTSLAEALCEEGLATVHFSASRYGAIETALIDAEARAKALKKNIHTNYDPAAEAAAEAAARRSSAEDGAEGGAAAKGPRKKSYKQVTVVHVEDAITFYGTYVDEVAATTLGEIMKVLAETTHAGGYKPKKNEVCSALFDGDNSWYRAKVMANPNDENPKYEIKFIDYGNTAFVASKDLAVLPEGIPTLAAQAVCMKLALLTAPPDDYMAEATELLDSGITMKTFSANEEYQGRDGEFTAVSLVDEDSGDDIALTMLSYGYATVNPRKERGSLAELQKKYAQEEEDAKAARAGMWIYGDVTEDPKDI